MNEYMCKVKMFIKMSTVIISELEFQMTLAFFLFFFLTFIMNSYYFYKSNQVVFQRKSFFLQNYLHFSLNYISVSLNFFFIFLSCYHLVCGNIKTMPTIQSWFWTGIINFRALFHFSPLGTAAIKQSKKGFSQTKTNGNALSFPYSFFFFF